MMQSNTSERLKYLMKERHLRQVDILNAIAPYCKAFGVKLERNALSQYVSGKAKPRQDKLTVLGLGLNVSEAWLMGYDVPMERIEDNAPASEPEHEEISTLYQSLDEEYQRRLLEYAHMLLKVQRAEHDSQE